MNFTIVLQILSFLVEHKQDIKDMILKIEALVGEAAGPEKAAIIRAYVGTAMNLSEQVEVAWPFVAPFFNLLVKVVKGK
jgi:hypothetical protein